MIEEVKEFDEPYAEPSTETTQASVPNELLQEKIDEIEILQSQLQKEREHLRTLEKKFADLSEEY